MTCVAEFIGGGIRPYSRVEVFNLMPHASFKGTIVYIAEVLFVASIFYYVINLLSLMKTQGCRWINYFFCFIIKNKEMP